MFDIINSLILWWHWIIIGIILITAEIFVPIFVIIWFGVSAIIIGFIDYFFKISFQVELSLWIILSILFTVLWFKFFKEKTLTNSGQSNNSYDTKGVVIEKIELGQRGLVKFDSPILGASKWIATSDNKLEIGVRVKIEKIKGQLIKVKEI